MNKKLIVGSLMMLPAAVLVLWGLAVVVSEITWPRLWDLAFALGLTVFVAVTVYGWELVAQSLEGGKHEDHQ